MPDQPEAAELQFQRAEFSSPQTGPTCASCGASATPEYHEFQGKVFCTVCRQRLEASIHQLRQRGSLAQAFLYGLGAAIAGSVVFYVISAATGYQLGLIAVAVGWFVGKAVRKGSGGLGGRRYQVMAVLLTYASIASTSVPSITRYFDQQAAKVAPAATTDQTATVSQPPNKVVHGGYVRYYALVFGLALALPFLNITRDFLGLIIIAIGLWEAWRFTRGVKLAFAGPFAAKAASQT